MTAQERMTKAIQKWILKIDDHPGWRNWKRSHIRYTLWFDEEDSPPEERSSSFNFPEPLNKEHALLTSYMELASTAQALRDVEWYFRRYPFSKTPVTHDSHLRYCCEMYFNRFYEFKERLKKLSKAYEEAVPDAQLNFGDFIKSFNRMFDCEIRQRNKSHHHEKYDDVAISRLTLLDLVVSPHDEVLSKRERSLYYRRTTREWASRTKRRAADLDKFTEAVAEALLKVCSFLDSEKETAV